MATREEWKQIYKDTPRPMGVYQIRNLQNGKVLIGSSHNLDGVANRHFFQLKFGSHRDEQLLQDYRQYGAEAFVFEVLATTKEADELEALEDAWLAKVMPYGERGYNQENKPLRK